MHKTKQIQESAVCLNIPLSLSNRSLGHRQLENGKEYRELQGPIVVDRRSLLGQIRKSEITDLSDHFNTFFDVDGFLTDPSSILMDFNHHFVSIGGKFTDLTVNDNYPITIRGNTYNVRALILTGRIYEDSVLRFKNQYGQTIEDGNALEALENGRLRTWSIYFVPKTQSTDKSTGITTFKTYHVPYVSMLDEAQGIPDAKIDSIRSVRGFNEIFGARSKSSDQDTSNNNKLMKYNKGDKVRVSTVISEVTGDDETGYTYTLENGAEAKEEDILELQDSSDDGTRNKDLDSDKDTTDPSDQDGNDNKDESMDNTNSKDDQNTDNSDVVTQRAILTTLESLTNVVKDLHLGIEKFTTITNDHAEANAVAQINKDLNKDSKTRKLGESTKGLDPTSNAGEDDSKGKKAKTQKTNIAPTDQLIGNMHNNYNI